MADRESCGQDQILGTERTLNWGEPGSPTIAEQNNGKILQAALTTAQGNHTRILTSRKDADGGCSGQTGPRQLGRAMTLRERVLRLAHDSEIGIGTRENLAFAVAQMVAEGARGSATMWLTIRATC